MARVLTSLRLLMVAILMVSSVPVVAASSTRGPDPIDTMVRSEPVELLPPPVVKPAPDFNGRTDLPNGYEPGAIKLKLRLGLEIEEVLSRYGLGGPYRNLSPAPFSKWDVAAGIDRNFRVVVPTGTEKPLVAALSQETDVFEWVHMIWLPNGDGVGSGTSYAAPLVGGVLALLRSMGKSPSQQWTAIAATAQYPGGNDPNGWSTYGLVNAGSALWY